MAPKKTSEAPADGPARSMDDALATLTWAGPAILGGALRFYDLDGKPLTPDEVADRRTPEKVTGLSLSFISRR